MEDAKIKMIERLVELVQNIEESDLLYMDKTTVKRLICDKVGRSDLETFARERSTLSEDKTIEEILRCESYWTSYIRA